MARKCKHGRTKSGKCRKATKRGCKCATRDLCVRKLRFVSRMKKGQ